MHFIVAADTDIGISKTTNQDSVCIKTAMTQYGRVGLALICDGMGGLAKGELASATVIRSFSSWFERELPDALEQWNWEKFSAAIDRRLRELNQKILSYGARNHVQLGTTVTGMLMIKDQFMQFHIGDTRIYKITDKLEQLTKDHTFIRRELDRGTMTPEQAKRDPRRNVLLQCVGASKNIDPEIKYGTLENGVNYLLCSDGFRHVITEEELQRCLNPKEVCTQEKMQKQLRMLIEGIKKRNEKDNISAILIRPEA